MADPSIVKEWLDKADEDFRFAEANLREGSEFYTQICFHFQQAAEKYLKAFIISKGLPFEKVHDLVHLLRTCSAIEPAFDEIKGRVLFIDKMDLNRTVPFIFPARS